MRTLMRIADSDSNGVVTLNEFTYLVKNLKKILSDVYEVEAETDDANDWCYCNDPESQKPVCKHRRTLKPTPPPTSTNLHQPPPLTK